MFNCLVHDEVRTRMDSGNACLYSFGNCYHLIYFPNAEDLDIQNIFSTCLVWVWNMVPYFEQRTYITNVWIQGAQ